MNNLYCDYYAKSTIGKEEKENAITMGDIVKKYMTAGATPYRVCNGNYIAPLTPPKRLMPEIKNVIFNAPATIVFWADGTKTVVKAQDDDMFDPEKGLAMAISKKALGNKGNYCNELKKWLPKEETLGPCTMSSLKDGLARITEAVSKAMGVPTEND